MTPADLDGLRLESTIGGTRLRLRVRAGARRNAIAGVHDGALKIEVTNAREKGKANRAVLRLLAEALDLPVSALLFLWGTTSRSKTIIAPLDGDEIRKRLSREAAR